MAPPMVLMVAGDPDIARTIASTLSGGDMSFRRGVGDSSVYEFKGIFLGFYAQYKVTSVAGPVFSVGFPRVSHGGAVTDPLDLFKVPISKSVSNPKAFRHLTQEAHGCNYLVLWLNCNREGENICFEVMESAGFNGIDAGGKVYRARFSSVTKEDIRKALGNLVKPNRDVSLAVDARREIYMKVGVAFSRFQIGYFERKYRKLDSRCISYGPCQTPTLGFCVQRYLEITAFKPEKFWVLHPYLLKGGYELQLNWGHNKLSDYDAASTLRDLVKEDGTLVVTCISSKKVRIRRPPGLNTVNMLKAASSVLGYGPQLTMKLADSLYSRGFISCPYTESTAYPASFDFESILEAQSHHLEWGFPVLARLVSGYREPEMATDSGDHPPITPTHKSTWDMISDYDERRLYWYICQHFFGTVSPDCQLVRTTVELSSGGESFYCVGQNAAVKGFTDFMPWLAVSEKNIPQFKLGEKINITKVELHEVNTPPPDYLSESELISLMEKHGIGTNTSISVHIHSIQERGYVQLEVKDGRRLVPTALGITLIRGYLSIDPDLCSPAIPCHIEQQITLIAMGKAGHSQVVEHVLQKFMQKFSFFVKQIDNMDALLEAQFSKPAACSFVKCGKCVRYMKYSSIQPAHVYCETCKNVYYLSQIGTIKELDDVDTDILTPDISKERWIEMSQKVWDVKNIDKIRSLVKLEMLSLEIHVCGSVGEGYGAILRDSQRIPIAASSKAFTDSVSEFCIGLNAVKLGAQIALKYQVLDFVLYVPSFYLYNFVRSVWDPYLELGRSPNDYLGSRDHLKSLLHCEDKGDIENIYHLTSSILHELENLRTIGIKYFVVQPVATSANTVAAFLSKLRENQDLEFTEICANKKLSDIIYKDIFS